MDILVQALDTEARKMMQLLLLLLELVINGNVQRA